MDNRIYSVIENKKRELDSRVLFALSMNEKGFSVGFGKKQNLYQYSNFIKKGLFLLKSIGPRNLKTILNLKKKDIKFQAGMRKVLYNLMKSLRD